MRNQVRVALAAACVSLLFGVGAAGAKDGAAPSAKPAVAANSSSAHLKADRQLLAMLSGPAHRSYSPMPLNDDPDPSNCLNQGDSCSPDNSVACCSNYCAPDGAGGGTCSGR